MLLDAFRCFSLRSPQPSACCEEPHCRSTEVPGTWAGHRSTAIFLRTVLTLEGRRRLSVKSMAFSIYTLVSTHGSSGSSGSSLMCAPSSAKYTGCLCYITVASLPGRVGYADGKTLKIVKVNSAEDLRLAHGQCLSIETSSQAERDHVSESRHLTVLVLVLQ